MTSNLLLFKTPEEAKLWRELIIKGKSDDEADAAVRKHRIRMPGSGFAESDRVADVEPEQDLESYDAGFGAGRRHQRKATRIALGLDDD